MVSERAIRECRAFLAYDIIIFRLYTGSHNVNEALEYLYGYNLKANRPIVTTTPGCSPCHLQYIFVLFVEFNEPLGSLSCK